MRKISREQLDLAKMQAVPMVEGSFDLQVKLTGIKRKDDSVVVFTQPVSGMVAKLWADQLGGELISVDYVASYSPVEDEENEEG